jgi:hypothetical protein
MRRVILESPLAADTPEARNRHRAYGRACVRHALLQADSPIAPHLLWTDGSLDDTSPLHRQYGFEAASWWYQSQVVEAIVVYCDLKISPGMAIGIRRGMDADIPIEYRTIGWGLPDGSK